MVAHIFVPPFFLGGFILSEKTFTLQYFVDNTETPDFPKQEVKIIDDNVTQGMFFIYPNVPFKSGYQFLGWTSTKGSTTVQYKPGSVIIISANNDTTKSIYSIFKKIDFLNKITDEGYYDRSLFEDDEISIVFTEYNKEQKDVPILHD